MKQLSIPFLPPVSLKEKVVFARQLAAMLSAGLHLSPALEIIAKQTRNEYFREAVLSMQKGLEEGKPFAALIGRYPSIFDRVFVNIVRAGEQSGQLELVLKQLALQLNQQYTFLARIKSALIYPMFVVAAMIAVAILAATKIIPQLKVVFEDSKLQLPLMTRVVIGFSDFLINYWYLVIIGLLGLAAIVKLLTSSDQGQMVRDRLLLADPTGLAKNIFMARFCRTLGMMLHSGIPIVEAIKVVSTVVGNRIYKASLTRVADDLERGLPMSLYIQKNRYFPMLVGQMIFVGEQTGQLDQILLSLADYFEEESEVGVRNLTSLFEPLVIVIIGVGIGFLVYAVILPIYNLAQAQ